MKLPIWSILEARRSTWASAGNGVGSASLALFVGYGLQLLPSSLYEGDTSYWHRTGYFHKLRYVIDLQPKGPGSESVQGSVRPLGGSIKK